MPQNRFYFTSLMFLVGVLGYLTYEVLKPFLTPLVWAFVLSLVFYPLYVFILRFTKWGSVASLISLLVILLLILGPFSYFSFILATEMKQLSDYLQSGKLESMVESLRHPHIKALIDKVTIMFGYTEAEIDRAIVDNMQRLGKEIVGRVTSGIGDVITGIVNFIFMGFTMFFFLKDGATILRKAHNYMPFSEVHKTKLEMQIRDIVISTIYGGVAVAVVEGIIGGVTFYLLGMPSPVLWGFAISVASFIPLIGASAIWGPATVYLFVKGAVFKGIALGIVGAFGISLIDGILKPIIIGNRMKMPVIVIFFSVLGGIRLFGLIGLVMGPLVLALFVSVIEMFRSLEGGTNA